MFLLFLPLQSTVCHDHTSIICPTCPRVKGQFSALPLSLLPNPHFVGCRRLPKLSVKFNPPAFFAVLTCCSAHPLLTTGHSPRLISLHLQLSNCASMSRSTSALRHHPTDRFVFSDIPPSIPECVSLDPSLQSVLHIQRRFRREVRHAFPTETNVAPSAESVASLHTIIYNADVPFNGNHPSSGFIDAVLQTGFVNDLLYCFRLATRSDPSKHPGRFNVSRLLALLHVYVTTSDRLAARLAENHLTIPLLFTPLPSRQATDVVIPLIEEVLHSAQETSNFEIASLGEFSNVISRLSPFQLGAICRVFSLFLDDRDSIYVCSSADSSYSSSLYHSASSGSDWRRIDNPQDVCKSRRSYLDPRGKLTRDRNHAALLTVPCLLEKLVKIISIPPPCGYDISIVDETLRRGIDFLGSEISDIFNSNDPAPFSVAIATAAAEALNNPSNNSNIDPSQRRDELILTRLRQHILVLVYKRLVGSHLNDNFLTHIDTWEVLDLRIEEAKQRWTETGSPVQTLNDQSVPCQNPNQPVSRQARNILQARDALESLRAQMSNLEINPAQDVQAAQQAVLLAAQEALDEATQLAASFAAVAGDAEIFAQQMMAAAHAAAADAAALLAESTVPTSTNVETSAGNYDESGSVIGSAEETQVRQISSELEANIDSEIYTGASHQSHTLQSANSVVEEAASLGSTSGQDSEDITVRAPLEAAEVLVTGQGSSGSVNNNEADSEASIENDTMEVGAPPQHNIIPEDGGGGNNMATETGLPQNAVNEHGALGNKVDELIRHNMLWITSNMMLTHTAEALSVLYSLLSGKRGTEVRDRLIQLGIVDIMRCMLDAFEWKDARNETRTEDMLKVHLLRVIHYICDGIEDNVLGDPSKAGRCMLFTKGEFEVIQTIEDGTWQEKYVVAPVGTSAVKSALLLSTERDKRELGEASSESKIFRDSVLTHFCPIHEECRICNATPAQESPACESEDGKKNSVPNAERGLMMKIVGILMKTLSSDEVNIGRRYLLSGCVETFQRCASTAEKTFVGRQGLVEHLVRQLCESFKLMSHKNQFRQTSFDLLGHLVKWNRDLFGLMNELLTREHAVLSQLLQVVSERLIDSNVFVRSIALSLERFRAEDVLGIYDEPYSFKDCVLWTFLAEWRARIIFDLMRSVHVDDVDYENISCVNTTLIMFVLYGGDSEQKLDALLKEIGEIMLTALEHSELEPDVNLNGLSGSRYTYGNVVRVTDAIQNFKAVVQFWMEYYIYQASDVTSLEISTDLAFVSFVSMAHMLLRRLEHLDKTVKEKAGRN